MITGKGLMTRNNRVPNYGSAPPAAASSSSSSSSSSASCSASTTVSTKSAQNHKPERPPSFKEPRTQHNYDERRRFATAFLCWLVGGFFGAHHFYLRGWKQRFSWIYSVTSFLSLMTSVLLYTLSFNPFATLGVDPSSELFLKWLVYCAPVVTPALRWIIDVSRIPRMVQRANAPASLLSVLAPLNTADAYSMSFSGIVFGAHWLYLRPFPGNTWNSDWTEAPSPTTVCWKRGLLYFFLLQVTFGGCGIWWLYDLFRMPVHVDALLGRRRNEKHKYQPSALLLVVLGSWCGLHNFYLFGWRSRYAKLYGISSLTSTGIIGLYLSTVKILDKGFCASTFHPYHNSTSTSNNASHVMHEVMHAQGTYTEDYYSSSSTSNPMAAPATWYVEGVCWSWRIFFWLQIIAMCLRLLVDLIRVGVLGLHSNLNSDLHDREDTLARQVTYVNTYMLCLPAGIIGTHRIFLNGMTSITLIYIVTAGMLGLGWIYDLLDVPRLIDDQFSEARRVLFHAVPTAPNEQQHEQHGQHGQQGQQGQHNEQQQRRRSAIASSFSQRKSYHGPSPYGPAQPPASWRDHLVDGLAQTLQEESNGAPRSRESFNATSLSSSNTYTRGVGEKKEEAVIEKESMYGSSLKGSIAGRRNEQDDAVALDVKASSSLIIVSAEGEDQQQDGTMDPSLRTPLRGGSSNQNRERSTSPPNMVLPAGATTAVSTVVPTTSSTVLSTASTVSTVSTAPTAPTASSNTSLAPQSSPASAVSSTMSFSSTSSISSPQKTPTLPLSKTSTPQRIIRGESSDNVATSLPPPSTPIHRIVRVHSVKHIHSPTCHPMSESLKASSSFKMIGNHNALKNGRASPNDSRYSRSSSRRQSRVSDVDLNFLTRDDIDRLESAQYMQKGMDGHFNSSSGGNGSSNNNIGEGTKKLSSIWLIEFELIQLGKKIAAGGSGQLFEARYVGTDVAVKELFTALIDSENIEDFKRETVMLMQLQHPHIVQFYGVSYHDQHYYIVQELCKGSMYDILNPTPNAHGGVGLDGLPGQPIEDYDFNDPVLILNWATGIARGLAFMHAKSIVHRDLKPQNILIDRSRAGVPKICDFGLSRMYDSIQNRKTKVGGTAAYLAPEVIGQNHVNVATPVDVFAFAVTFWWMLHRADPYPNLSEPQILMGVYQQGLRPTVSSNCPKNIRSLIEDCWIEDPMARPTMGTVLERLNGILTGETFQHLKFPL